jgi:hypothetical protein
MPVDKLKVDLMGNGVGRITNFHENIKAKAL